MGEGLGDGLPHAKSPVGLFACVSSLNQGRFQSRGLGHTGPKPVEAGVGLFTGLCPHCLQAQVLGFDFGELGELRLGRGGVV